MHKITTQQLRNNIARCTDMIIGCDRGIEGLLLEIKDFLQMKIKHEMHKKEYLDTLKVLEEGKPC